MIKVILLILIGVAFGFIFNGLDFSSIISRVQAAFAPIFDFMQSVFVLVSRSVQLIFKYPMVSTMVIFFLVLAFVSYVTSIFGLWGDD